MENINKITLFYPHNFHKTAKNGEPLYIQVLGDLKVDELFRVTTIENIVKHSTQQYERMIRDVFPACSIAAKRYVHGLFSIIDIKKLNRHLVCKKVYNLIQADMTICQNYFPESLGESYIINAGFLFKTMYTIIKAFLDAKTRSKKTLIEFKILFIIYTVCVVKYNPIGSALMGHRHKSLHHLLISLLEY